MRSPLRDDYVITLDVDWASDAVIAETASILIAADVKATWFVTHDSPEIRRLSDYPDIFELGIHPNFAEGSSHGNSPREVLRLLKGIVPEAKSVRTHSLIQSTPLLRMMRSDFDLHCDVSLLLLGSPNITPHQIYYSDSKYILRLPFFWEDDFEMYTPSPSFLLRDAKYHVKGLKIFNFHPIHIALNSSSMHNYAECKSTLDIRTCSLAELTPYVNKAAEGTGTFFRALVKFIKDGPSSPGVTISELFSAYSKSMA